MKTGLQPLLLSYPLLFLDFEQVQVHFFRLWTPFSGKTGQIAFIRLSWTPPKSLDASSCYQDVAAFGSLLCCSWCDQTGSEHCYSCSSRVVHTDLHMSVVTSQWTAESHICSCRHHHQMDSDKLLVHQRHTIRGLIRFCREPLLACSWSLDCAVAPLQGKILGLECDSFGQCLIWRLVGCYRKRFEVLHLCYRAAAG